MFITDSVGQPERSIMEENLASSYKTEISSSLLQFSILKKCIIISQCTKCNLVYYNIYYTFAQLLSQLLNNCFELIVIISDVSRCWSNKLVMDLTVVTTLTTLACVTGGFKGFGLKKLDLNYSMTPSIKNQAHCTEIHLHLILRQVAFPPTARFLPHAPFNSIISSPTLKRRSR